jgi:hypothetical protein
MAQTVRFVTMTRGNMRPELAQFREWVSANERRYNIDMNYSDAQPIANNRNRVALATREMDADFLLTVDSDMVPLFNPFDYVEYDLDVLGFPYPTWRVNAAAPLFWYPGEPDGSGLRQVEDVGGGCMLIARRVLEHPAMRAPFMDAWDEDGRRVKPEDTTFCGRAKEAGFEVWCCFDVATEHFKPVALAALWRYIRAGER